MDKAICGDAIHSLPAPRRHGRRIAPHTRPRGAWPRSAVVLAAVLLTARPAPAFAHVSETPVTPETLWRTWSWEPFVLAGLLTAEWGYFRGLGTLWRRAGVGRGIHRWQAAAFTGGVLAVFIALVSPLDALGGALFSGHMGQHLALTVVAAPLLVLGEPMTAFLWALPKEARRRAGRWWRQAGWVSAAWHALTSPLTAWVLDVAALWIWHLPGLYQATLTSKLVHTAQHGSFFATALLFWWTIIRSDRRGPFGYAAGVLSAFTMALQGGLLGALITFAAQPWYPAYAPSAAAWGLTPLEDQQLAGLLMWIPPGLVYLLTIAGLLTAMLRAAERRDARREAHLGRAELPG